MKRNLLLLLVFLICSCQSLPVIQPFDTFSTQNKKTLCVLPYPEGSWQFIHSIEATMPNNKNVVLMGITNISSKTGKISVVMMTIEGLVLFEADLDTELNVHKSIPPFDSDAFAKGLMGDIKLVFLKPKGNPVQTGHTEDAGCVYRFKDETGDVVDIKIRNNNAWEIDKYNNYNRLIRSVKSGALFKKQKGWKSAIPQKIEIVAFGNQSYILKLELIEAKQF